MASDVAGPVNIGAGRSIALGELARMAAARLGAGGRLVVETRPAPGHPLAMRADVARLRNDAGAPPPQPLDIHLDRLILRPGR